MVKKTHETIDVKIDKKTGHLKPVNMDSEQVLTSEEKPTKAALKAAEKKARREKSKSEEKDPIIDDFEPTSDGGEPPITSVQITEEDRLKVFIYQLEIEKIQLEAKLIDEKFARHNEKISRYVQDLRLKYDVPEDWKLNPHTGNFTNPNIK